MALTDSLVSYWKLDEASGDALDAHGSNDLTDNNAVGSATGKINNARDFQASSSHNFSHASNSDLVTGDIDFTLTAWVNLDPVGGNLIIVGKDDDTDGREYTLDVFNEEARFYCGTGGGGTIVTAGSIFSFTTWYFVVAWFTQSDGLCRLQINNGTVQVASSDVTPATGTANFRIGARDYSGFEGYFDGLIDEVGLWKRVLTSDERTELYNGGDGLSYDDFDGGGGASGQPTMRRWGGVPYVGGQGIGNKSKGRMWGRTHEGVIVPRRFAA